ncbi:MAG: redoxin domain-containing protein [Acidobacteriota bacterium]
MAEQIFGEPLPGFTLTDLDGSTVSLDSAISGKRGAVVVFWSGVCSHCRRYDDYLNAFRKSHPDLALVVVGSRQDESVRDMREAVEARQLGFPILSDPERRVSHSWLVRQTPRAFLVDAERRLLYRGAIDNFKYPEDEAYSSYLEPAIHDFLTGREIERQETASFGCPVESTYYDLPSPLKR